MAEPSSTSSLISALMDPAIIFAFLVCFAIWVLLTGKRQSKKLPPGSMGIPYLGQSISFLKAMRTNRAESWVQERIEKYGPISKANILGTPTVIMYGQAANKFLFTADSSTLGNQQPTSLRRILGNRNIMELKGDDHKRVRGALVSFLKADVLKRSIGKMDEEVNDHLKKYWYGKKTVEMFPLSKVVSFDIICTLLFGVERKGERREQFVEHFKIMMKGMWSIPINLPFTRFNESLHSREVTKVMIKELLEEKRLALKENRASPNDNLITCLLSIRDENNKELLTENEIIDNIMLTMVAGHDTSSTLLTFMVRLFAKDPAIYAAVLEEQDKIAKSKAPGERLTWDDLLKMKYTWRVAMETLRMIPPVFGSFRTALKDLEYGGYHIPKGWKLLWLTHSTHQNESIFPEPQKFDPNRFENQSSVPPYCFVAFGGGTRICPGYEFAKIETLVTVHYLVTKFKWKLACEDDSFSRDPMPVPAQGLPIHIEPREA